MITSLVISTMIMENIHHAAAAVATVIALSLPAAPVLAGVLDADGISAQIIGKELVARRMGMKVHLRYDLDGTATTRSPFFSGTGSWRRDGNRLCVTVAGTPGPEHRATASRIWAAASSATPTVWCCERKSKDDTIDDTTPSGPQRSNPCYATGF